MTERLRQLYQQVILHHSKHPVHFEKRTEADFQVEAYNPLCGDKFQFYVDVVGNSISELHFQGMGCAISKASASVMVELLEKLSVAEANEKCSIFLTMLEAEEEVDMLLPDEMQAFTAARSYPARKKCASLAWETMQQFLAQQTS